MGRCIFCGNNAGVFRTQHATCKERFSEGCEKFRAAVAAGAQHMDVDKLKMEMKSAFNEYEIPRDKAKKLTVDGWTRAAELALDDHLLSDEEEKGLMLIASTFGLKQVDLDLAGTYTKVAQCALLRDLSQGKTPDRVAFSTDLPFNFQKNEVVIWGFGGIDYYEDKTRRETVGRSAGMSVRVAKGVYVRTGASRGRSVEYTDTVHRGNGICAITNKHLYFGGSGVKALRIRHDKIVSVENFEDGVEIHRDAVTAKPQKFIGADGWFFYNLLMNASNI